MAMDSDLRRGLADWRNHAVTLTVTLIPVVFAAAIAWGVISAKVDAATSHVGQLEDRVQAVEKQTATIQSDLVWLKESQTKMDDKLDKLLAK